MHCNFLRKTALYLCHTSITLLIAASHKIISVCIFISFSLFMQVLVKGTHVGSTGVKHVSDSFAHFKQQLTSSLGLLWVLLQI